VPMAAVLVVFGENGAASAPSAAPPASDVPSTSDCGATVAHRNHCVASPPVVLVQARQVQSAIGATPWIMRGD